MGIAVAAAPLVGVLLSLLPLSSTVEDEESPEVPDPLAPLELDPVPVALVLAMVLVAIVIAVVASAP